MGGEEGFMIWGCSNHRYFPFVSTLYAGRGVQ